jgi:hypothetical protein
MLRKSLEATHSNGWSIELKLREVYRLLAEGCHYLHGREAKLTDGGKDDDDARFVLETVRHITPCNTKSPVVISAEEENKLVVFLTALNYDLKETLRAWDNNKSRKVDVFGSKVTTAYEPEEVHNRYLGH